MTRQALYNSAAACTLVIVFSVFVVMVAGMVLASPTRSLDYGDFAVFYDAAGRLSRGEPLYIQAIYQPYLNPPFFALALEPLLLLPRWLAGAIWGSILYLAVAGACRLLLGRGAATTARRWWLWAALLSAPVTLGNLQYGQNVALVLLGLALWYRLARNGKPVAAGLALGLVLIKPQFLAGPVLVMLVGRRFRELLGAGLAGIALGAVSLLVLGWQGVSDYLALAAFRSSLLRQGASYRQDIHSPTALWNELLGSPWADVATGLTALLVAGLVLWCVRQRRCLEDTTTLAVLAAFWLGPHAHIYDLLLLIVPWLLLGPRDGTFQRAVVLVTYLAPIAHLVSIPLLGGGPGYLTLAAMSLLLAMLVTRAIPRQVAHQSVASSSST